MGASDWWLKRVAALPPASVVHVPVALREKHALVMASLLEGMAEGSAEACALEYARTKLLLAPVPRSTNNRCELARRLERWKSGSYEELLCRAENQSRTRCTEILKNRPSAKQRSRARRARSLVQEGAYSKAATSLISEVAKLTGREAILGRKASADEFAPFFGADGSSGEHGSRGSSGRVCVSWGLFQSNVGARPHGFSPRAFTRICSGSE